MQPIADYNVFFERAKTAVNEAETLSAQIRETSRDRDRFEFELNDFRKSVAAQIQNTKSKRRDEITKTYDTELYKLQEQSKKIRSDREKAKYQGIKVRVDEETQPLRTEISSLEDQRRTLFKNNGVPAICNTRFYYNFFYPENFSDWMGIILTFLVMFVFLPVAVWYFGFKGRGETMVIVIYLADILFFGGILMLINRTTVRKYEAVLQQGNELRSRIRKAEGQMAAMTRTIQADKDETRYNLGSYDDRLSKLESSISDVSMRKKEALHTFDSVTGNIITDEINSNAKERIDELNANLNETSSLLASLQQHSKQKMLEISDEYEVYLGKEFMTLQKINALQTIMNSGTATNISEAIAEYRKQNEF